MSSSERQHWQKKIAPEGSYGELWACSSEGAGYLRSVQRLFLYFFFYFFFNFETKPTLLKHSGCSGAGSAVSASRSGCLLRARAAAPSASTSICAAARWSGSGNGSSWTLIPGGKRKKRKKKSLFSAGSVPQPGRAAFGAEDTCLCAWAGSTGSVMPGLVLWHRWLAPPSKRLSGLVLIYHHFNVWCHRGYHAGFHPQNHSVAFCRVCWGCSRFPR